MVGWRASLYAAVRHSTRPAVLLLRGDSSWSLPRAVVRRDVWTGEADAVVPALEKRLGTGLWQYRQIHAIADEEGKRIEIVFEMDLVDPDWLAPANGRWVGLADLGGLRLRHDRFRPVLDRYLRGLESGVVPAQRTPWCGRGWLGEVRPWIESAVGDHRVTSLTQVKQWSISNVMRVGTDGPTFYFKVSALLALFVNEAVVSWNLAILFPGFVSMPLAMDPETGWMLLADLGEVVDEPPLRTKMGAFRRVADLHIRSIAHVEGLLAAGCHDRRLAVLASQIDPLLADKSVMGKLESGERRRIRSLALRLRELCAELATYAIPPTLVHGDFHMGNVGPGAEEAVVFDWSDACIAHPFFDLHSLDWEKPADRPRLLAAYLEVWEGHETTENMERVLALARVLTPLHQAVSYQFLAAGLEPDSRPELDFSHEYVRKVLTAMEKLHGVERTRGGSVR